MAGRKDLRIVWNEDLRLGLDILMLEFKSKLNNQSKLRVFSRVFDDHMRQSGYPEVTWKKLDIQFHEKKNKKDSPSIARQWQVCTQSDANAARRRSLRARIDQAIQELNVPVSGELVSAEPRPTLRKRALSPRPLSSDSSSQASASLASAPQGLDTSSRSTKRERVTTLGNNPDRDPADSETSPQNPQDWRLVPRTDTTIWHQVQPGYGVWISARRKEVIDRELVYPAEEVAHPKLTTLLYRTWDERSQSPLTAEGFLSGSSRSMPTIDLPHPPNENAPMWKAMAAHLNREKIPSPFISCSMNLLWIVRLALQEYQAGHHSQKISIIDASRIDRARIFHAQPFHAALCKKMCFTNGAFRYRGKYEFLCYDRLERDAVIKIIKVSDLYALTQSFPGVNATLRLDQIAVRQKSYPIKILPELREHNIRLTPRVIRSIADIVRFLGVPCESTLQISGIVSDICSGWGLLLEPHSEQEWLEKAGVFAEAMTAGGQHIRLEYNSSLEYAFLDGIRWGYASDANPRLRRETACRAMKKARVIGLESPASIIANQLDAAKMAVMSLENVQHGALQGKQAISSSASKRKILPSTPLPSGKRHQRTISTGLFTPDSNDDEVIAVADSSARNALVLEDGSEIGEEDDGEDGDDGSVYAL